MLAKALEASVGSISAPVSSFHPRNDKSCCTGAKGRPDQAGSDRQPVSLLAFVEEENRALRRAVIDLAIDTLLLKEAARGR
jgi:hypothetical protein